jgi:hypothetical protein
LKELEGIWAKHWLLVTQLLEYRMQSSEFLRILSRVTVKRVQKIRINQTYSLSVLTVLTKERFY